MLLAPVLVMNWIRLVLKSHWYILKCCYFTFTTVTPLSTDLDTSEDFSAELDRSHGFFTASGKGGRKITFITKTVDDKTDQRTSENSS